MSQKTVIVILTAVVLTGCVFVLALLSPRFSISRSVAECGSVANKALCYRNHLNNALADRGLSAAFDLLAVVYNADPDFAGTCHGETHKLGKAAYVLFHNTKKVELSDKASYCGYGFYHGFMEALLRETNNLDEARAFCAYAGKVVSEGQAEGACYHGIGHGVTDGYDPELWGNAEALSLPGLALCRQVAPEGGEWGRRCAAGVFNAIALFYRDPHYRLVTDNPFLLCDGQYTDLEKEACYYQMNTWALAMGQNGLARTLAYTEVIPRAPYRKIAVEGIAVFYVQTLKSAHRTVSPQEASEVCGALANALREACMQGLVDGIMEFGEPEMEYQEALALCAAPDLSADLRPVCYKRLALRSELFYTKEKHEIVCREIPELYQDERCHVLRSSA